MIAGKDNFYMLKQYIYQEARSVIQDITRITNNSLKLGQKKKDAKENFHILIFIRLLKKLKNM